MGCCISKCRPEKHSQEQHQFNHVHDKLVISQSSPTSIIHQSMDPLRSKNGIVSHQHNNSSWIQQKSVQPLSSINTHCSSNKILPSPHSPTSSTSSISSFTNTTTSKNTISSTTSSLSTASTSSSALNRSFSNEFLWSCYKDNPHIIRINSLKEATTTLNPSMPTKPNKVQPRIIKPSSPSAPLKLSPSQKVLSMPQKRVRSNSPTNLTRQKSFRKETERSNIQSRTMLGSPSPSRRFNINGDKVGYGSANNSVSKISAPHCVSSSIRKESFKAASPLNNSSRRFHNGLRQRETCTAYRVGSKIDETVVNDVLSNHDMDSVMEDIDNPLISLDCFIFL